MKLTAVINPLSGSVPADAEALLRAAAEEAGVIADVSIAEPDGLRDAIETGGRSGADALAVWGGDGSVACALEALGSAGMPVLPLPGGTMNMLHRRVHGVADGEAIDWRACLVGALRDGGETSISAGCVNDERRFYVGALFGELAGLSRAREAIREGRPLAAAEEASETGAFDLATSLAFHELNGEEAGLQGKATALAAFVPEQADDWLEVGWIDPDNLAQLAGVGLEIALGDWRSATGVVYHRWPAFRIFHARESEIETTLDGEPVRLPSASLVRIVSEAARVLAARAA